jgi:hypothetical protein
MRCLAVVIIAAGASFGCWGEDIVYDLGQTTATSSSTAASGGASTVGATTNGTTNGTGGMAGGGGNGGGTSSSTDASSVASTADTSSSSSSGPLDVTCGVDSCGPGSICTCTGSCDACDGPNCETHNTKATCDYTMLTPTCQCKVQINGSYMNVGSCDPGDQFCLETRDQCCEQLFIEALGG